MFKVLHGQTSGVRLLVRPGGVVVYALPVPRQACLGLARAVLAAATDASPAAVGREDDPQSVSLLALTLAPPWGGSRSRDALAAWLRQPWCHPSTARPAAEVPDLALACWLTLARGNAVDSGVATDQPGAGGPRWDRIHPRSPHGEGSLLEALGADLVAGRLPAGVVDVDEAAWGAWTESAPAAGPAGGQSVGGRARVLLERLAGGDGPVGTATSSFPASAEGATLVAAMRLVLAHLGLAAGFQDAVGDSRLDAIRELAYGAGHEINNPLANIATRAQTLLLDERDPERRRRLSTIVDQAFRARDLIGGLMLFARPPRPRRVPTDVHSLVATVVEGAGVLAAQRRARLEYAPAPEACEVAVDKAQVEEALRAVVSNALEAVGEGGFVAVSVNTVDGQCEIVVADDGRGMDPATLRRAFDPFFSGREAGRGVGLGLSKAWRFLHANGGDILIESRLGLGTRARITLPLLLPREAPENAVGGNVDAFGVGRPGIPSCGLKVDAASPR